MSGRWKGIILKLIILVLLALLLPALAIAAPDEARGIVTNVVEGDTIDVQLQQHNSTISSDIIRVRLVDIDCPEMGTFKGSLAEEYTSRWLQDKMVYLDIDYNSIADNYDYDRCVAVVYLADPDGSLNTAQNFNRMLVDSGNACVWDFTNNEFKPADWWGGFLPTTVCIKTDSSTPESSPKQTFSLPTMPDTSSQSSRSSGASFVGSIKSDKYHYPSCQWAKKISPSNEIWFSSSEDARSHGYVPCKVCNPP